MEQKIQEYTPSSRDLEWARKYKQDLKKRDDARKHKQQYALYMWVTLSSLCHALCSPILNRIWPVTFV